MNCLVDARAEHVQSLVWDAHAGSLFWIDTPAGRLSSVSLTSGVVQSWSLPCPVAAIAPCADGRLLTILLDGIYLFDPATHDLHFLAAPEPIWTQGSLAGGVGPDNALWIGGAGALLRVTADGGMARVPLGDAATLSGLSWSADGRTMCVSEAGMSDAGGRIGRGSFDPATGTLSDFSRGSEHRIRPSGGAMDVEGAYWSCDAAGGSVARFAADGRMLTRIALAVPAPTACCFGGPEMNLLFVGSRRAGLAPRALSRSPASGGIFMIPVDVAGVPHRRFTPRSPGRPAAAAR